jgi:hypothetical protein
MQCRSCGTSISASFKYAIAKNECPACGNQIFDEEYLALIEDVGNTIRSEAAVREETAHNLAVALVAKYDINPREAELIQSNMPVRVASPAVNRAPQVASHKIAPPSGMQQAMQNQQQNIIRSPDLPDGISDRERERIFEEAVRAQYNMVDQVQADAMVHGFDEDVQEPISADDSIFSEGAANPILEKERLARLAKQQRAMNGGGQGVFRRGS